MSITKFLLACAACASLAMAPLAQAAQQQGKPAATAKKKNGNGKKAAAGAAAAGAGAIAANGGPNEEADEPNIADHAVTEYACELGNKITIYKNANDIDHIALRWKQRLHRLTRVATTTGAERYENKLYGLIWIGIPAKGMLLDSKANRQLANECKTAEQKNGL
jgi:membrane-bound inhibitor of C-type lysozyme